MVTIRSVNEIILSLIDFFKLVQPDADTKPGTVIRDLVIDGPSNQISLVYDELSKVSNQQSFRLVVGSDLDKLAKNFGLVRKVATTSSGIALLTFNSIVATITINQGDVITAANGFSFAVANGLSIVPSQINYYKSLAAKYQNDLTFVGISDPYAVQVSITATTPGSAGNISKYALNSTTIPGISNVTNVNAFLGGNDQEDDATFRNRVLSLFSGSSIGTSLGYKNTALSTNGVIDCYVVSPGDPLMTRDGSIVTSDSQGNLTIVSEGTGGKVDIVILGTNLVQNTDSFIYQDKSNNNDPTNAKNNFVLGQIVGDANKTFNQKRIGDIAAGTLPEQPVDSIVQVTGSLSGSNFLPESIDSLGRITGNYKLIKDTGVYAGSPWGFDTFAWINNQVSFSEDKIKGKSNGQDPVTFSDVLAIPQVQQNLSITNENSNVLNSNRSLVQLLHTPATAVTRVFNVNTGERYTIVNQNPNGTGAINTSGVVQISGNTLPSQSDVLQVDYSWVVTFDQYFDYDGLVLTNNSRVVDDSIDWGYSNLVRNEKIVFARNQSNTFFVGSTSLPINSVITAATFSEIDGYITTVTSGVLTGRLAITFNNLTTQTTSVNNVFWKNTNVELYNTAQNNGSFTSVGVAVGLNIQYDTTIILPTDTKAQVGDRVTAILNQLDLFNITNSTGNFSTNQITIPVNNFTTVANSFILNTAYIANVQSLVSTGITTVPFSRIGNGFTLNNSNGFNNTYASNVSRRENQTVQQNGSNQLYVELNLSSVDDTLDGYKVISVIRLSDGYELWNRDFPGTIAVNGTNNNYQLIFSGYGTPVIGDRVLALYYAVDNQRFQSYTFKNYIYERDFASLQFNPTTNNFSLPIHKFIAESGIAFQILEPNTDVVLASGNDGVLTTSGNFAQASFTSSSVNFSMINDLAVDGYSNVIFKKIRLINAANRNNSNIFNITAYTLVGNVLTIQNDFSKINNKQISIIRVADGQELWSDAGMIDLTNNQLLFPATSNATASDLVFVSYYEIFNIKQCQTKLGINITDQVVNTGTLSVAGTTITKAQDIVFSSTSSTLSQTLLGAIRTALGLNSNAPIPSNVSLVKIAKLERVTTTNSTSNDVLESRATYDLFGTSINDNTFFNEQFISNSALGPFDFILPNTTNNALNVASQNSSGDKFRITFYYATTNDLENVAFTKNGTLYTNKQFALINKVYVSSGFGLSKSARLTISNFNQPITGARFTVFYNYLAPKQNERIIIQSNYNQLVGTTTFNVETNRPINADVLVREAKVIDIDVTMNVVITSAFSTSSAIVLQNLKDKLASSINANGLGTNLDSSSLINAAFSVDGIGGARIQYFNQTGVIGQVTNIQAHNDQYFVANNIIVNQVSS